MTATLATAGVGAGIVVPFGLAALGIVLLTGLSRVYLGVHFPSDIVGGYFIGATWSVVAYSLIRAAL